MDCCRRLHFRALFPQYYVQRTILPADLRFDCESEWSVGPRSYQNCVRCEILGIAIEAISKEFTRGFVVCIVNYRYIQYFPVLAF